MRILKEGFPFIFSPGLAGLALIVIPRIRCNCYSPVSMVILTAAGILLLLFACFCVYFFRDPKIKITSEPGVVLSPCNGTVFQTEETENEKIIRVFLSIFSVHLQRSPVDGIVTDITHKDGKFLAAWNPQAHILNEQNTFTIQSDDGVYLVQQIAGFLARRCVSWIKTGAALKAGDKIGMIKFSSQVDIHLPKTVTVTVKKGDKVRAGITIAGRR
ncbi:MAG: phosphatidylserine decarboxylase [Treponema sp.]|nr:phosphatidylserine decarboxylase [Treponema sp.]